MLKEEGAWTVGMLANHIWSVAGDSDRADVSSTFLQPFLSRHTPTGWTFGLNSEATYDWEAKQWSVPINATIAKMMKFGEQRVQLGGGVRYWADSPESDPHGWGYRFFATFLFPK